MSTDLIQIKNSNLDSNNWVNCQGVTFSPAYKRIVKINPLHGQVTGTAYLIAKEDSVGVENPSFTLRGIINTNDFSDLSDLWSLTPSSVTSTSEDSTSMAGAMTLGYLLALWRDVGGTTYIKINFGSPDSQTNWKNYDQSSTSIEVSIDAVTPVPRTDSEGSHLIDYEISCTEVRS